MIHISFRYDLFFTLLVNISFRCGVFFIYYLLNFDKNIYTLLTYDSYLIYI